MASLTSDERTAMQESLRRLLKDRATEADLRRTAASEPGFDASLWRQLGAMGMLGLLIDAEYGGIGAGAVELELVMEEVGASLLCSPFLSSSVLAAALLSSSSDDDAKARLLPGIAAGERIATVALTGEAGRWMAHGVTVKAIPTHDTWLLSGIASYVTSASIADTFLVLAMTPQGLLAFEVEPAAAGLAVSNLDTFDRTLRLSKMVFDCVAARPIAGADTHAFEKMMNLARVALAGEQTGGARRVFEMTVEYIKSRIQFGRPVGGFQAIKHMAADLLLEVESATSAARHAAQALAAEAEDAPAAVSLAAFACADAFSQVAAASIQMHGGIGFTWEHPAHLYLRRARADAQLFGSPSFYRERYVAALEGSE
ncbi:MAG: acyl-CoA dehydrogenase family protein [Steroidobacteraceae bacterium]